MKICTKCKKVYEDVSSFYKDKSFKDGLHPQCKSCRKKADRARYLMKSDEICKKQRARYKENADKERENAKKRYKRSISTEHGAKRVRDLKNKWSLNKSKTDPSYRISKAIGSAIRSQVKKNGVHKFNYLGYSCEDLMIHLEKQFTKKMNWDNYGSYWHIDHIIPKSSFTIKNAGDDEFMTCWSLTNLRPLEAIKNLTKGSKIESLL